MCGLQAMSLATHLSGFIVGGMPLSLAIRLQQRLQQRGERCCALVGRQPRVAAQGDRKVRA